MKCRGATSADVVAHISKFLLSYRTSEHSVTGQTPSQLLMGRRVRNKLDFLKPDFYIRQNNREWQQVSKHQTVNEFKPSPVMVRSYNTDVKWVPGQVTRDLGRMHYEVNVDEKVSKRHVDQLKPYPQPDQVTPKDQSNIEPMPLEIREENLYDNSDDSNISSTSPEIVNRRVLPARGTRNSSR